MRGRYPSWQQNFRIMGYFVYSANLRLEKWQEDFFNKMIKRRCQAYNECRGYILKHLHEATSTSECRKAIERYCELATDISMDKAVAKKEKNACLKIIRNSIKSYKIAMPTKKGKEPTTSFNFSSMGFSVLFAKFNTKCTDGYWSGINFCSKSFEDSVVSPLWNAFDKNFVELCKYFIALLNRMKILLSTVGNLDKTFEFLILKYIPTPQLSITYKKCDGWNS